ncbi:TPA: hypothetical protein ACGORU_000135 [Streptococcus suis]
MVVKAESKTIYIYRVYVKKKCACVSICDSELEKQVIDYFKKIFNEKSCVSPISDEDDDKKDDRYTFYIGIPKEIVKGNRIKNQDLMTHKDFTFKKDSGETILLDLSCEFFKEEDAE